MEERKERKCGMFFFLLLQSVNGDKHVRLSRNKKKKKKKMKDKEKENLFTILHKQPKIHQNRQTDRQTHVLVHRILI